MHPTRREVLKGTSRAAGGLMFSPFISQLHAEAAEEGRLTMCADVEREVRRLPGFSREYFDYGKTADVFEDDTCSIEHEPKYLVRDADQHVPYTIRQDKQVLQFLLTPDRCFLSCYGAPEAYYTWREEQLANTQATLSAARMSLAGYAATPPTRRQGSGHERLSHHEQADPLRRRARGHARSETRQRCREREPSGAKRACPAEPCSLRIPLLDGLK